MKYLTLMFLSRACLPSVQTLLIRAQVQWEDHVIHMLDEHILKQLLLGNFPSLHGGQEKHYKGTLKAYLKSLEIDLNTWEIKLPYLV